MSDIEIVRACAEAMGLIHDVRTYDVFLSAGGVYDPLHDDAQAMALVKKFNMSIERAAGDQRLWRAQAWTVECSSHRIAADLNRAICLCVANLSKEGKRG